LRASDALDRAALARHLAAAVREAGDLALKSFKVPVKSWFKTGNSPVSEADIAVDALLRERLEAAGLACGWLSEETEDDPARLTARQVWIVDPIDGTRAFLAGLPDWSISVALAEAGRPILAAIFAPVAGDLYLASAGGGATCNDRPMMANAGAALAGARVAGPKRYSDGLSAIEPTLVPAPKVHSLALRLAWVAQGRLDIAFTGTNSHDWDLAAADLLVHEAHGALTTLAGDVLTYNRPTPTHDALFAAGRARHQTLRELMRDGRLAFR
jgi:myo-inositol-1(or 4)-monophosphatase